MGIMGRVGRVGTMGKREHYIIAWQCGVHDTDNADYPRPITHTTHTTQ